MKRLTQYAKQRIRKSPPVMAALMVHFNRGAWSIEKWLNNDDPRLTEPAASKVICDVLGMNEPDLYEPITETTEAA